MLNDKAVHRTGCFINTTFKSVKPYNFVDWKSYYTMKLFSLKRSTQFILSQIRFRKAFFYSADSLQPAAFQEEMHIQLFQLSSYHQHVDYQLGYKALKHTQNTLL